MGGKLFQGVQALGKSRQHSGQLTGDSCKVAPRGTGHLNGTQPCGAMKVAKSCKEGVVVKQRRSGSDGRRFKTRCQQGLFSAESR